MESHREKFLRNINEFIFYSKNIPDGDRIKTEYLDLVKKYHPDINREIDGKILNEYMIIINNTYEMVKNGKAAKPATPARKETENNPHVFNFETFYQLLAKISEMGVNKKTARDSIFTEYRNLLLMEIRKDDDYASRAFELLFWEKTLAANAYRTSLFSKGIRHYFYLLRQTPPGSGEENIPNPRISGNIGEKVAESYFLEYIGYCNEAELKDAAATVMNWLKGIYLTYGKP